MDSQVTLLSLPNDAIHKIAMSLTYEEIAACSLVSKKCKKVLFDSPYFWKLKLAREFPIYNVGNRLATVASPRHEYLHSLSFEFENTRREECYKPTEEEDHVKNRIDRFNQYRNTKNRQRAREVLYKKLELLETQRQEKEKRLGIKIEKCKKASLSYLGL
jgi:hypothetical protein